VSEAELKPGEIVADKYQIVEPIGVGGSATVYRAQRVSMTQEVALKVMHSEHPDSENEKIRFAREAELVMKLQHPHVVPLLDYGHTEDDVPFLVFALLQGRSLEARIRSEGPMAWAQAGRLSVQILKALERAHSLGVVHRDIKPANIFLSEGVLGEVAQVLDFGLAKMVKEPDANLTQAGALLGTPRYMAPEQVRGEMITHAADIYSFGLVMAEMLLGRPLVTGAKELDIYVAQGSDKPIHVPDEVLSTPYGNIIRRAVNKKVEVRYHMASQMLADVQAALENLAGPQEDIEADLDATRMLDPSSAAVLSNPHAEKMRRVLNAAAKKKAQEQAAAQGQQPSKTSAAKAERPTRMPPRNDAAPVHEIEDEPTAVEPIEDDPGPPPPIPAAAYDSAASAIPRSPLSSNIDDAAAISGAVSSSSVTSGAAASGPAASGAVASGPAASGPAASGPVASGPVASGPVASSPVASGPVASDPAISLATPSGPGAVATRHSVPPIQSLPPSGEPKSQTGLAIALVLVVLLILAGIAAILWMLGIIVV
jgi:serine/threonine-protein kinase